MVTGAGVGMAYNALISGTLSWFPDKTGLLRGLDDGIRCQHLAVGNDGQLIQSVGWRNTYCCGSYRSGSGSCRDDTGLPMPAFQVLRKTRPGRLKALNRVIIPLRK